MTANKIDFDTFDDTLFPIVNTTTSNLSINSDRYYSQYSYEVPISGVYFVSFSQRLNDGGDTYDFAVRISKNDTAIQTVASGGLTYTRFIAPTACAVFRAETGDTISCLSKGGGPGTHATSGGVVSIARII